METKIKDLIQTPNQVMDIKDLFTSAPVSSPNKQDVSSDLFSGLLDSLKQNEVNSDFSKETVIQTQTDSKFEDKQADITKNEDTLSLPDEPKLERTETAKDDYADYSNEVAAFKAEEVPRNEIRDNAQERKETNTESDVREQNQENKDEGNAASAVETNEAAAEEGKAVKQEVVKEKEEAADEKDTDTKDESKKKITSFKDLLALISGQKNKEVSSGEESISKKVTVTMEELKELAQEKVAEGSSEVKATENKEGSGVKSQVNKAIVDLQAVSTKKSEKDSGNIEVTNNKDSKVKNIEEDEVFQNLLKAQRLAAKEGSGDKFVKNEQKVEAQQNKEQILADQAKELKTEIEPKEQKNGNIKKIEVSLEDKAKNLSENNNKENKSLLDEQREDLFKLKSLKTESKAADKTDLVKDNTKVAAAAGNKEETIKQEGLNISNNLEATNTKSLNSLGADVKAMVQKIEVSSQASAKPEIQTNNIKAEIALTGGTTKLESSAASTKTAAPQAPRAMEQRIIEQIITNAKVNFKGETKEMTLRLDPPNLGQVKMKLSVQNHVMTGRVEVENHTVKAAVENNLNALRNSLNEEGVKVDKFEVVVRNGGETFAGEGKQKQHEQSSNNSSSQMDKLFEDIENMISEDQVSAMFAQGKINFLA